MHLGPNGHFSIEEKCIRKRKSGSRVAFVRVGASGHPSSPHPLPLALERKASIRHITYP